jgi:hypothetical protein
VGMHYGFVAVPSTVDQFVSAFTVVWPKYEPTGRATLSSMDEYLSWKKENERFVSARDWTPQDPGIEVYGFVQDGTWAVLLDTSYVLASDKEALAKLSASFGGCVSFIIETAGGSASFMSFGQGRLARSIDRVDGKVTTAGDPISEEAGLRIDQYYMVETEELQRRLGFRFLSDSPPTEVVAVATMDRTDYTALLKQQQVAQQVAAPRKKPWWRLW